MSQENDQTAGRRLRWWQEETTTIPSIGGVAGRTQTQPLEVDDVLPDIGLQLEQEALQRTVSEARGERVTILSNPPSSKGRLLFVRMFSVAVVTGFGLLPLLMRPPAWYRGADMYHQSYFWIEWACLILAMIVIQRWGQALNQEVNQPRVTLTKSGMEIHTTGYDLGLISWDEIASISSAFNYVAIQPKNFKEICRRLPRRKTMMMRLNYYFARPYFFLPERLKAPIPIGTYLSIPATELLCRIEEFRARNGV